MDPDANLEEQLRIVERLGKFDQTADRAAMCDRLAELVTSLDDWITGGGFLPARWRRGKHE